MDMKMIHLLYVPTLQCNMSCSYCYLGCQTDTPRFSNPAGALETAIDKLIGAGIFPLNISLHGGEVTTLPGEDLDRLFGIISAHYLKYYDQLSAKGIFKMNPHIKTNLLLIDKHYDLLCRHKVSISGSIDLPLELHRKHRLMKNGADSLDKILDNIRLLSSYPYDKKMSATLYSEHLERWEEITDDILFLHNDCGFDMNRFNFMFGFNSTLNDCKFKDHPCLDTTPPDASQQVRFYNRLKDRFAGTELEYGFKRHWFDEFTPSYCTNSRNCGEKFFLLQADGKMYSCVRGQGDEDFYYGNLFEEDPAEILQRARKKIDRLHELPGIAEDCRKCGYLHICNTGCPFVKKQTGSGKSYTCELQQQIYQDSPASYPLAEPLQQKTYLDNYLFRFHPSLAGTGPRQQLFHYTREVKEEKNALWNIIQSDLVLQALYSADSIVLQADGQFLLMQSQLLRVNRDILCWSGAEEISVHIKKELFLKSCSELVRNGVYVQVLQDLPVVYGDEKRVKQSHLFNYIAFYDTLLESSFSEDFLKVPLTDILKAHQHLFRPDVLNNLFVTTISLRDYHYSKQKSNAFYHLQAINLPFQNVEFFWGAID